MTDTMKPIQTPTPWMAGKMSKDDAMDFADSCDLPDGAYWAMIEEMSGAEPADFISDGRGSARDMNSCASKEMRKNIKKLEKLRHKVVSLSHHHYRIDGRFDWWPSSNKWKLVGNGKASQGFAQLVAALKKEAA